MKIQTILAELERHAPPQFQESYDNAGLLVGRADWECSGVLICLDSTEAVVQEAIARGCNLIVAHHPIVFGGLKRFNGRNYIERTVMLAIKHDVAIYAMHTNLDNMHTGVNARIAARLGLVDARVLAPKRGTLRQLVTYVPTPQSDQVRNALFEAGAGAIGKYDEASFNVVGAGTFRAGEGANPHVGEVGKRHIEAEMKIELIFTEDRESAVIKALLESHPYEEVAYNIIPLANANKEIGAGMIGQLPAPMEGEAFLHWVKEALRAPMVRYTASPGRLIQRVAVCGGSGSFLLPQAIGAGADAFVTADFKYHQFFDADGQLMIADIGHYESEQFTIDLFHEILTKKFNNFAVYSTEVNTNPVKYI